MSFSPHVNNIVSKASKYSTLLGEISINAHHQSKQLLTVCPILEYASSAWDPHLLKNIHSIDQIQCRAALWVLQNYNCYSSVTSMYNYCNFTSMHVTFLCTYVAMYHPVRIHSRS